MTVAYVGNFVPPFSTENDVARAFEALGWTVVRLQENRAHWSGVRDAALKANLVLWTATWDDAQPLKETVDTLRQCAMKGIPTATLHLDIFWGLSRAGRKWWLSPMFFTRYVFTADGSHQDEWKRMGVDHHWLRPGVRHDAVHPGTFREQYACDVAFVGSDGRGYHEDVWGYRARLIFELERMCARNGWTFRNPGGRDPKVDRGEDLNDFYASAKVTVGDSLCLDREKSLYCSDRVYEATGRGGLLIMPQLDFLSEDFDSWLPLYPWAKWHVLEGLVRIHLEDTAANKKVREQTQRITAERHTYANRVEEMLGVLRREGALQ